MPSISPQLMKLDLATCWVLCSNCPWLLQTPGAAEATQQGTRALGSWEKPAPADKKPRWVVQRPMWNSAVCRFIPVMLKPENLRAIPFVAWDCCDRCNFIRYAQGLNHFCSPGEFIHTQHAPEEGRRCRLTRHKVTKHSGSPVVNPGLFTNNYVLI